MQARQESTGMDPQPASPPAPAAGAAVLRRATSADVDALLRLRVVMHEGIHGTTAAETVWSAATAEWLVAALDDPATFAAFVVDEPGRGVVSVAVGRTVPGMPSPRNPSGLRGHVFNVATDADRRRRGYARRCMEALLAWFRADTAVGRVELHASADGIELYRSLGFVLPREPALQLTLER
jgi:ribosomal protein S18 acetylase RimI-like enzyme